PIGNSAYNPVTIENKTGAADVFCSRVLDELYSNGTSGAAVTEPRVKRTWDISKDNPNAGAGVNFVFNWNAGETVSLTTPALFHYGSSWVKQTAGATNYTSNSLTYTGYTGSFSPFGIADANSILPVTWLNFEVQKQNDHALLVWTTAGEINNKDFVVEHSMNGKDWKSIGVVKGALNSFSNNTYQFIHDQPSEGINYYRLRQRDLDGRNSFSSVQTVKFEPKAALVVYPNPVVGGVLHVRVAKAGMLKMYTGNGQLILQKKLTASGQYSVNLSHVAKGVYRLAFDNKTISIVLQ
ncbi:MAG TPA: T9SS type A sorting domain-containing protein, partial [Agriterribacter sp.]|nr:T9SS type A sorting domain-containing protein [Agriterribacter sp.]